MNGSGQQSATAITCSGTGRARLGRRMIASAINCHHSLADDCRCPRNTESKTQIESETSTCSWYQL